MDDRDSRLTLQYVETEKQALQQYVGDRTDPDYPLISQFKQVLSSVFKNIRVKSLKEGLDEREYENRIFAAAQLLENLKSWMNPIDEMNSAQKKLYNKSTFWFHRNDIVHSKENWPVLRYELRGDAKSYFETTYMQDDDVDCLLIDALIYAEVAAFKVDVKEKLQHQAGGRWHGLAIIATTAALVASFFHDRFLFLALVIAVTAYKVISHLRDKNPAAPLQVYSKMLGAYMQCMSGVNASVIWDMLEKARDQGAIFDAVLYDLLERQMQRTRGKIQATK